MRRRPRRPSPDNPENTYDMSWTDTNQLLKYHTKDKCEGDWCCLHNPSNHHMVTWPLHFRGDRPPLMERICKHGREHPDPDSLAWLRANFDGDWETHGCCGCCIPPEERGS